MEHLSWGSDAMRLTFTVNDEEPVALSAVCSDGRTVSFTEAMPVVQITTPARGHVLASKRLVQTEIATGLRYARHEVIDLAEGSHLEIEQQGDGIRAVLHLEQPTATAAVRASVTVINTSETPLRLLSVASWAQPFGSTEEGSGIGDWRLQQAESDWLAEGRWSDEGLDGALLPQIAHHLTGHNPRGALTVTSNGTWSTGTHLPAAVLYSAGHRLAWAWQIEHNGPWRYEVGEGRADGYFALSGPTDLDHQWSTELAPGESFTTVPGTVAVAGAPTAAIGALTRFRRATRRPHPDNAAPAVVFNDYMNTLNGDPSTEKLLPLIDAAAAVGADVFCIDAGWYDDDDGWWDSVGEWIPSTRRFPGGLDRVLDHIREAGMIPGLWLEPEVIGVRSAMTERLPAEAFLSRNGTAVIEQSRLHLDLRSPAARAHLTAVVDRLVDDHHVGYFKLDYNIDPGPGTDHAADSVGAGLLEHNRAHLAWLEDTLDAHPGLLLENCGSGAMRADWAMLSRLQLQSTSDQQDARLYPPIAVAAPMSLPPEQAANWAYPQPGMTDEQIIFTLVTGLLGRLYLSGHLDEMVEDQLQLVREAVAVHKRLRQLIGTALPFWPLGLPSWDAEWLALGLQDEDDAVVAVWHRVGDTDRTVLELPALRGRAVALEPVFPQRLPLWDTTWDAATGRLTLHHPGPDDGARVFRLRPIAS